MPRLTASSSPRLWRAAVASLAFATVTLGCGVLQVNGQPVSTSASHGGDPAPGGGGGGGSRGADWAHLEIKGVRLGMPLANSGFTTCPMPAGHSKYAVSYFKIIDPRCAPGSGDTCAVSVLGGCTVTLNGRRADHGAEQEIEYLEAIATTETDAPRIYQITYYFPRQFLSETSPLGKALAAKYGPHCTDNASCYRAPQDYGADQIGGGGMIFRSSREDVWLDAYCLPDTYGNHVTRQCRLSTSDTSILEEDRAKQQQVDMAKAQANQAKPPTL